MEFGVFVSDYCRLKVEALGGVESDEETIQDVDGDEERHNNIENKEQDIDEAKNIPTHFKVVLTVSAFGFHLNSSSIWSTNNSALQVFLRSS